MARAFAAAVLLLAAASFPAGYAQQPAAVQTATLKTGDTAPDFTLPDQDNNPVRLSSLVGKRKVVLAFYVKAFTSG
ncbi:MAG: alkyl hydroperoxide reductase/Thiol specific antioxidant/Mal allergen [Acidobacteria bacterium]|jgi:cytochrome oxidase Cu insertion factor (SCO1/SenC/PrrC family)|nr:alkyl hydroperoxide reductase/Thiol specific antioxidant/Mal allergen [Acidobacteriota bacterium]